MKKRTLLRPTHLKVELKEDKYQIAIGKCFFKISLNDIKGIILSVNSIRKKL